MMMRKMTKMVTWKSLMSFGSSAGLMRESSRDMPDIASALYIIEMQHARGQRGKRELVSTRVDFSFVRVGNSARDQRPLG